jgi:HSP20 family molecular chaperone IbpA
MQDDSTVIREPQAEQRPALMPPVDVIEDEKGITLSADLPGVPKERLNVHVDGDTLVIEAEMGLEMPKDMEATHVEVSMPRYRRVFRLSRELDASRLSAGLKNGVLKVRIEKASHAVARRIEVRAD